jgi:hypothetical protein
MYNRGDNFDVGEDFKRFMQNQPPPVDPNQPQAPVDVKLPGDGNSDPTVGDQGPGGNKQTPVERQAPSLGPGGGVNPDMPSLTRPSPEARIGRAPMTAPKPTPPQAQAPSPVASRPPTPFAPLSAPDPSNMVQAQQFEPLGHGSLLGSGGGLLNGGLDVAGGVNSNSENDNILPLLLQMLTQGR